MINSNMKKIVEFLGYVAVFLIMIALILTKVVPSIADMCRYIAGIIGLVITVCAGYMYTRSKRNPVFIILFLIAIIVIIVMYVI